MTTPDPQPTAADSKDRVFRSSGGIAGGVLLLALVAWLGIDALVQGNGRTPWLALATMILVVPLIVAFTVRPAVYVNEDRLRIRNPFRVIVLPWGQIASLRSGYSNEVVDRSGTKFQLWAIPVSLRARKRAARHEARAMARGEDSTRGIARSGSAPDGPTRAASDQAMDDLRELLEARETAESAQGEAAVRWAYEIVGPAAAGAVLLAILLAVG
ncbi:PH domain-containing protein [Streptomyces sp. GESEQ-35]|uniref:PH domain-containing protein n=1 Tax=Streptomyces sp. GESEQ-35 TaxID=2812657 RepID=UPI001B31DA19|nr:PH domain-containing protein [Streptomyces sp. GESEQ-35]